MAFKIFGKHGFLAYTFCIWLPNPGFNITAVLVLGGFGLLGVSLLMQQLGFGVADPVLIEIGKASFYTGIGRAFTQSEIKEEEKEVKKKK